jgi:hypothetical protein
MAGTLDGFLNHPLVPSTVTRDSPRQDLRAL